MEKAHSDLLSFKNVTIILIATILLASWSTMDLYFMDEKELYNYAAAPSTGSSKGSGVVMYMLYRFFGKKPHIQITPPKSVPSVVKKFSFP